MASFSILVVPTNRDFIPNPDAVEAAAELLESFYPDREHGADEQDFETPRLVTAREGWSSLKCPLCGTSIERWELEEDDHGETWWTRFEAIFDDSEDAPAEAVKMPCCGAEVKAGDLESRRRSRVRALRAVDPRSRRPRLAPARPGGRDGQAPRLRSERHRRGSRLRRPALSRGSRFRVVVMRCSANARPIGESQPVRNANRKLNCVRTV